jgi:hypothetical protein
MIRKLLLLLALLAVLAPTPARATELNSDTGFDNAGAWMKDPASPNLWTVSGSKANGNSATLMQMLMQMNSSIKEGHKYRWQVTVSSRTTGILKVGVGLSMPTTPTFTALTAPISPISDPFTTASGLHSVTALGTGDASPDVRSAFRMFCSAGPHKPIDPVVYPGQKGVSHLHRFFGNTGVTATSNYASLRSSGGTTCGSTSPLYPINRSGYWLPDMLNGYGMSIQLNTINVYYKTFLGGSTLGGTNFCNPSSGAFLGGAGGSCVNVPTGLRMIMGYNTATGLGGPADGEPAVIAWQCWERTSNPGVLTIHGPYQHLNSMFTGGANPCVYSPGPNNSVVGMFVAFPTCWDGVNLDSSNHRSHMAYAVIPTAAGWNKCDDAHPYMIPSIELQLYWEVDANFAAGKWHLASDEMVSGAATDPGMTFHTDYMMAWSPTVLNQIMSTCWLTWDSCGSGDLGNGTAINGADTPRAGKHRFDLPMYQAGLSRRARNVKIKRTGGVSSSAWERASSPKLWRPIRRGCSRSSSPTSRLTRWNSGRRRCARSLGRRRARRRASGHRHHQGVHAQITASTTTAIRRRSGLSQEHRGHGRDQRPLAHRLTVVDQHNFTVEYRQHGLLARSPDRAGEPTASERLPRLRRLRLFRRRFPIQSTARHRFRLGGSYVDDGGAAHSWGGGDTFHG